MFKLDNRESEIRVEKPSLEAEKKTPDWQSRLPLFRRRDSSELWPKNRWTNIEGGNWKMKNLLNWTLSNFPFEKRSRNKERSRIWFYTHTRIKSLCLTISRRYHGDRTDFLIMTTWQSISIDLKWQLRTKPHERRSEIVEKLPLYLGDHKSDPDLKNKTGLERSKNQNCVREEAYGEGSH